MTTQIRLILTVSCLVWIGTAPNGPDDAARQPEPSLRTYGVRINVEDLDEGLAFYGEMLGFGVERRSDDGRVIVLTSDDRYRLLLYRVERLRDVDPAETQLSFTLQVNDLDRAIARMKAIGVAFGEAERRKEGVGYAISIVDPFGRRISMMHQTIVPVAPFREPRLYNFGFLVPDMEAARAFYGDRLGFVVRSEKYLPLDLPLGHADGTFAFMLHHRPGVRASDDAAPEGAPFNTLVFETDDLAATVQALRARGVKLLNDTPVPHPLGRSIAFEDPFGNVSEVIAL